MSDPIEASQQFLATYFGGNSKLFEAIDSIDKMSINGHLDGPTYQEFVFNEWLKYLASFEDFPTLIERFWWSVAFEVAGMSFVDLVMNPYLKVMVAKYWEQFKDGFKQSKNEGLVPNNIKTAKEYLALLFAPPEVRLYTDDPVYQVLGVKTGRELEALSYAEINLKLAKMVVDGTFVKLHNAAFHDQQRAYDNNDAKGDCKIDEIKLQRLYSARRKPSRDEKQCSIDAQLEDSGVIHKGFIYRDDQGNVVHQEAIDNSGPVDADQTEADRAEARIRLVEQLKPRELDLFYAELERLEAKKTREQWYGTDKAPKVTQRVKYLKTKYSKH